jgi:hypothetical protein
MLLAVITHLTDYPFMQGSYIMANLDQVTLLQRGVRAWNC